MDQPALIGGLGPSARIRHVASEPQRIWSRIHQRYSRKRRRQAAATDIPKIKEAGCAHCCFSRCNRIARKRDTKNGPRRQRTEMTPPLPDPAHGLIRRMGPICADFGGPLANTGEDWTGWLTMQSAANQSPLQIPC